LCSRGKRICSAIGRQACAEALSATTSCHTASSRWRVSRARSSSGSSTASRRHRSAAGRSRNVRADGCRRQIM
jgi:hypothetical protein